MALGSLSPTKAHHVGTWTLRSRIPLRAPVKDQEAF